MWGLISVLERAIEDSDVRVLVLTGAGRGFCAGGDIYGLDEVVGAGSLEEQAGRLVEVVRIIELLYARPQAVDRDDQRAVAGAGLGLACATDIRIAARDAVFTTAFLSIGVSGDYGGTWTLPRIVGPAMAKQLYLESDRFGADRALAIGLIDGTYEADALRAEAARRAQRIAGFSPFAVERVRANFRDAIDNTFAEHLEIEAYRMVETQASPESKRAVEEMTAAIRNKSRGQRPT